MHSITMQVLSLQVMCVKFYYGSHYIFLNIKIDSNLKVFLLMKTLI